MHYHDVKQIIREKIPGYKYWKVIRPRIIPILNLITFIGVVIINILAGSTRVLGGYNTAEISDLFPSLFTPAGYAFGIWGVIYTLLTLFLIVQLPSVITGWDSIKIFENVGLLFILSNCLNFTWIFLWQYQQIIAAAVFIALFAAVLILIHIRLGINYSAANRKTWAMPVDKTDVTTKDKVYNWLVFISEFVITQISFSVYAGWLTAATLANLSAACRPVLGSQEPAFVIAWLTATTCAAAIGLRLNKDIFYSTVIFWAVLAIGIKQQATPSVFTAAICNCTLVGLGTIWTTVELIIEFIQEKYDELKESREKKKDTAEERTEKLSTQQV